MGLTQKILLFTSLLVVALVVTTLTFTTFQADRLAHRAINDALSETRGFWEAFQADRYNKLKLGVRVLGNDSPFKAAVETKDPATISDLLQERGKDLGADFFIATDPAGIVLARSDRPVAPNEDLSKDPLVMKPLEGEESATVWKQEDKLYHTVSVPMRLRNEVVGVLIAGYGINEALAHQIRKLTHSEVACLIMNKGQPPQLSVSSLEGAQQESVRALLSRPEFQSGSSEPFEEDIGGERHVLIQVPMKAATGETVGSLLAIRSLAEETASFRNFRNSLILVSLGVMLVGLAIAYVTSRSVTGPLRLLVDLVERARDGSYSGAVSVETSDEIGTLARTFNSLMADLREKQQMIGFLREGITLMKSSATRPASADVTGGSTASLAPALTGVKIEKGMLFAGRYEILGMIGKGGMGVVYRAQDRQLDETVALKVLRPDVVMDDPNLLGRFKQEIKLARKITHRNVLRTHDFYETDSIPYISMEYLEGVTLKELIASKGALPLGVGLRIAKQICQGLEAAHRQGVIHRDIKPQNMLILPETGELKIMDFGIARVQEMRSGGLTSDGTVLGTPDYIPPEQAQGKPADFRSDIYSLGVVLFEVFTGVLPFKGDSLTAIILGHLQKRPPRPRSMNPRIPEDLEALILRCMEKDPGARYAKVSDILRDLTAISSRIDASAA
jgi:HAMP domain-containing protein/predicted Ser/Thr protein kinase